MHKKPQNFDYTKLRLADDFLYESEEEDKQTDKKPNKKEPLENTEKSHTKEVEK